MRIIPQHQNQQFPHQSIMHNEQFMNQYFHTNNQFMNQYLLTNKNTLNPTYLGLYYPLESWNPTLTLGLMITLGSQQWCFSSSCPNAFYPSLLFLFCFFLVFTIVTNEDYNSYFTL